jgi:hypothetical protein
MYQSYLTDHRIMKRGPVDDPALELSRPGPGRPVQHRGAASAKAVS